MSSTDEIRATLKGGPLKPSEIADALGLEDQAERTALYGAVRQMTNNNRGVELLDDGKVSLIPNWKSVRGKAAKKAKAEKPARKAKAAKADKPRRKYSRQKPAPKKAVRRTKRVAAEPQAEQSTDHTVTVSLTTIRRLIRHAMSSDRPLDADTRAAVIEATQEAA